MFFNGEVNLFVFKFTWKSLSVTPTPPPPHRKNVNRTFNFKVKERKKEKYTKLELFIKNSQACLKRGFGVFCFSKFFFG